jgi:carboxyl-terminal processing protease
VLIGPKGGHSYGKGSVQTISLLKHSLERDPNGDIKPSGLRLTTAKYYTPAGTPIEHAKGIKPDIGVEIPIAAQRDLLRHGLLGDPNSIEPGREPAEQDETSSGTTETTPSLTREEPSDPEEKAVQPPRTLNPEDEEEETSMTLEERLQRLKNPPPPSNGKKKAGFHDVLLDEAIKYMKAIMIYESRKAA